MRLDGFLAEKQLGSDLAVGLARGDELGDLQLAGAERAHACPVRLPTALEALTEAAQLALDLVAQPDGVAGLKLGGGRLQLATSWAQRARAAVLLAEHKPIDAAELALASAAAAAGAGACVEAARSRMLAGRALLSAGQRDRAVAE
ncbi:MAG: hypothetical protein QOJ46_2336, partial [bacterium]